jgi:prepilin-type N-terminal cleavage/methylation domain-containing protein
MGKKIVSYSILRIIRMELQKIAKFVLLPLKLLERARIKKESQGNYGFTLIETMVALAIFSVGIMAIGAMLIYSTKTRVINKQIEISVTLAHAKMEEIRKIATREIDVRYSTVLNFSYILSRDPNYGTIGGFALPGYLSGAAGLTALINDLDTKLAASEITQSDYDERLIRARVLYDDGDANHGDKTAGDGIWSSLEYINMDTHEVRTYEQFNALTNAERRNWGWIIMRKTQLEPVSLDLVVGSSSERTISHVALPADITDTTAADAAKLTVDCTFTDMSRARKERTISFQSLIARSSM